MACPYFHPDAPVPNDYGERFPLMQRFAGRCFAFEAPVDVASREECNRGYARACCAHFPQAAEADAIRLSLIKDDGSASEVRFIYEFDHTPVRFGTLALPEPGTVDIVLMAQARAFVESCRAARRTA